MSDKPKTLMDQVREYFATVDDETFLRDVKEAGFKVADKPQSLHEQLMELAEQIEREKYRWDWTDYPDEADKYSVWAEDLRHIAARVKEFEEADTDAPSR